MRGLTPNGSQLLEAFSAQLPTERRARLVADELRLEKALESGDQQALVSVIREEHVGASDKRKDELAHSYSRNRQLTVEINDLYSGRCHLCGFDSPIVYATPSAEAHHIVYRSRGGEDALGNLALLCPNHHTVIHRTEATFDYSGLAFYFPNGRVEPLSLNRHLSSRAA